MWWRWYTFCHFALDISIYYPSFDRKELSFEIKALGMPPIKTTCRRAKLSYGNGKAKKKKKKRKLELEKRVARAFNISSGGLKKMRI